MVVGKSYPVCLAPLGTPDGYPCLWLFFGCPCAGIPDGAHLLGCTYRGAFECAQP